MSKTPRGSLRIKLIATTTAILVAVVLATLAVVTWQSYSTSQTHLADTEALITTALQRKGRLTVDNQALALRGMVEANAFGDVKNLVEKGVTEDEEVLYGLFLDDTGRPWAFARKGVDEPDKDAWKALEIPEGEVETSRKLTLDGEAIWEFAAPVMLDGEEVGTIRYGLSTATLRARIDTARDEAWTSLLRVLGFVLAVGVFAMVGGTWVVVNQAGRITGPLSDLTAAANRIARGDKGVRAEVHSGDEIEVLAGSFNQMVEDLAASYTQLEAMNAGLEDMVAQRTSQLARKTDDMTRMLDNIELGIFTVQNDGTLHPEYSVYLETILESSDLAGKDFVELFLSRCDLGSSDLDAATVVITTSFGNPTFLFECNDHLLPKTFGIDLGEGRSKLLEFEWVGISNEEDDLDALMVIVRDVTELRALQEEARRQREAMQVVGELLEVEPKDVERFFSGTREFLARNAELVQATPTPTDTTLDELFRNMHTIKGNARLLGFTRLNDIVHEAEELYRNLRDGSEDVTWDAPTLLANLDVVGAAVGGYETVYNEKLSGHGSDTASGVPAAALYQLIEQLHQGDLTSDAFAQAVHRAALRSESSTVEEALRGPMASAKLVARDLGKEQPQIVLTGADPLLSDDQVAVLRDVFVHVLRNSVDHGLEKPEVREQAGKPAVGTIRIDVAADQDLLTFRVSDDGGGLALDRLREKTGQPLATPEVLAESLFQSGVSTAEAVTSVSGRGVGMDAVRQFLREHGGDAVIEVAPGTAQGASRAPFTLVLTCAARSAAVRLAS